MNKSLRYASLVSGLFFAPLAAVAHHSVAGTFDTDQVAETEGEVVLSNEGPRWSEDALGTTGPGFGSAGDRSRPELGIYRVWSTPVQGGWGRLVVE